MSENSKDDKNISGAWEDANKPLAENQHVVWYELGGKTLDILNKFIEMDQKGQNPDKNELKEFFSTVGFDYPVYRIETYNGENFAFPKIFAHPSTLNNSLYMMSPISQNEKDPRHFVPLDSKPLSGEELQKVLGALGDSLPILSRPPIIKNPESNTNEISF